MAAGAANGRSSAGSPARIFITDPEQVAVIQERLLAQIDALRERFPLAVHILAYGIDVFDESVVVFVRRGFGQLKKWHAWSKE